MNAQDSQGNLGGCLVQRAVHPETIMLEFDRLPKPMRDALNYADENFCVLCVSEKYRGGCIKTPHDAQFIVQKMTQGLRMKYL